MRIERCSPGQVGLTAAHARFLGAEVAAGGPVDVVKAGVSDAERDQMAFETIRLRTHRCQADPVFPRFKRQLEVCGAHFIHAFLRLTNGDFDLPTFPGVVRLARQIPFFDNDIESCRA